MEGYDGQFLTMDDYEFDGRRVYVRLDINSPINPITGEIIGSSRFRSHVETVNLLRHSKVVLVGHQSRPGKEDFTSLRQHAMEMQRVLGRRVQFIDELFGERVSREVLSMSDGDIIMLENTRFYSEEANLDTEDIEVMERTHIVQNLSKLFDYYVIDAFPAIHRAQTSLVGFRRIRPNVAGRLIQREVSMLDRFLRSRDRPKYAILAGAKIDDSIKVARSFLRSGLVDRVITGGVVANAFLWAAGRHIGKKNMEFIKKNNKNYEELLETCRSLLRDYGDRIVMPVDGVLSPSGKRHILTEPVPDDQILADIGVDTIVQYSEMVASARGIFMNGPMGMYEIEEYSAGTFEVFRAVASSDGITVAGGGHTLSALEKLGAINRITHASTGGGALISYLSGEKMPVLEALKESRAIFKGR
ncbi:phosphoglycerate kinase [Thermogymnomonas acidicola]|uniref:Phosphoglycerate kinase n=1 Tax=Thermogymnomonas acidicola TaxID=399579 RepID=A0AA37BPY5_9ARCH|nr:phosphoglycerate kinase [Thermogymnomonas acidicola]GGM66792.1 phosphoglycerate kinase [Thermogymnomonas acidicola]